MDPRVAEALQQAHDQVAEMIKQAANEPSLGLFFVQQHVHKAVPAVVALKESVVDVAQDAELGADDARDALAAIKTMKEVGPPVVEKMIELLSSAAETLHPPARSSEHTGFSVSDIAKDAKKLVLPFKSTEPEPEPAKTPGDSTNYAKTIWDSALDRASSMTRRSSAIDIQKEKDKLPAAETSSPAEAPVSTSSPYGYVRSVFESASQRVGNLGWSDTAAATSKRDEDVNVDSAKNSGDSARSSSLLEAVHGKPARYVRAVIDTALMRNKETAAGPAAEDDSPAKVSVRLDSAEESFDKFQAENEAKLAQWLDEEP